MTEAIRYHEPGAFERGLTGLVRWLTRRGLSLWGTRVLCVRGRNTGEWRSVPVNLLRIPDGDGVRSGEYLVSARGHTQWVRNLRVAGQGELRIGRRVRRFRVAELADEEKPAVLRAYLAEWGWEVGRFFDGVHSRSDDDEVLRVADQHPVFRLATEW